MTGEGDSVRCNGQKLVHGSRFVTLEVGVPDVADAVERDDLRDRLGDERKPLSPAGMKDHRLIIHDEVLADVESTGDGIDA